MKARSADPELLRMAKRVVWFKPPEEALAQPVLLLCHVMTFGTIRDISIARRAFTDDDFRHALRNAHPGVFDPRSWSYWHVVLGIGPAPPLPTRDI